MEYGYDGQQPAQRVPFADGHGQDFTADQASMFLRWVYDQHPEVFIRGTAHVYGLELPERETARRARRAANGAGQ